jgi:hypothetical protein
MKKWLVMSFALLGLLVLAACNAAPTEVMQEEISTLEISIDVEKFTYTAPEAINAGWVRVEFSNTGSEPHHVQFLRLKDGVGLEQFQSALQEGEGPAMALVEQVGGVGAVAPTGEAQVVLNLPAGDYVLLSFMPSPGEQVPQFVKGMLKGLKVNPGSAVAAQEPKADLTVNLRDYTFEMPESLAGGEIVVKVVNDGPEPHELNILALESGKTVDDVLQYLASPDGPPPFRPVGGMNGLDPEKYGYLELTLPAGKYVAICNIPSPKAEGHPHFTLGMAMEFSTK